MNQAHNVSFEGKTYKIPDSLFNKIIKEELEGVVFRNYVRKLEKDRSILSESKNAKIQEAKLASKLVAVRAYKNYTNGFNKLNETKSSKITWQLMLEGAGWDAFKSFLARNISSAGLLDAAKWLGRGVGTLAAIPVNFAAGIVNGLWSGIKYAFTDQQKQIVTREVTTYVASLKNAKTEEDVRRAEANLTDAVANATNPEVGAQVLASTNQQIAAKIQPGASNATAAAGGAAPAAPAPAGPPAASSENETKVEYAGVAFEGIEPANKNVLENQKRYIDQRIKHFSEEIKNPNSIGVNVFEKSNANFNKQVEVLKKILDDKETVSKFESGEVNELILSKNFVKQHPDALKQFNELNPILDIKKSLEMFTKAKEFLDKNPNLIINLKHFTQNILPKTYLDIDAVLGTVTDAGKAAKTSVQQPSPEKAGEFVISTKSDIAGIQEIANQFNNNSSLYDTDEKKQALLAIFKLLEENVPSVKARLSEADETQSKQNEPLSSRLFKMVSNSPFTSEEKNIIYTIVKNNLQKYGNRFVPNLEKLISQGASEKGTEKTSEAATNYREFFDLNKDKIVAAGSLTDLKNILKSLPDETKIDSIKNVIASFMNSLTAISKNPELSGDQTFMEKFTKSGDLRDTVLNLAREQLSAGEGEQIGNGPGSDIETIDELPPDEKQALAEKIVNAIKEKKAAEIAKLLMSTDRNFFKQENKDIKRLADDVSAYANNLEDAPRNVERTISAIQEELKNIGAKIKLEDLDRKELLALADALSMIRTGIEDNKLEESLTRKQNRPMFVIKNGVFKYVH